MFPGRPYFGSKKMIGKMIKAGFFILLAMAFFVMALLLAGFSISYIITAFLTAFAVIIGVVLLFAGLSLFLS